MSKKSGDAKNFDINWQNTKEAKYLHWCRGKPQNQIQFAFRQHWHTFSKLLGEDKATGSVLEVGCGRGSLSAYFADAGWDCTLLDLSSEAIKLAEAAFTKTGLKASFDVGDCLNLPYPDDRFGVVFSIGLLEHFEDIRQVLAEQYRVLRPGGTFFGYVVPELPNNLQRKYLWFNDVLRSIIGTNEVVDKVDLFRSDLLSPTYIDEMKNIGYTSIKCSGIYSLPMISHSVDFPFSLLPPDAEKILVDHFTSELDAIRVAKDTDDPWLCEEGVGQAFLLWAKKMPFEQRHLHYKGNR